MGVAQASSLLGGESPRAAVRDGANLADLKSAIQQIPNLRYAKAGSRPQALLSLNERNGKPTQRLHAFS
jgi:hypothetical protein